MYTVGVGNESFVSRMWDTERQLVLARRGEAELEVSLNNTTRDTAHYIPKSEHESMLKKREEDLVADMKTTFDWLFRYV
jgi:hypothetical protein